MVHPPHLCDAVLSAVTRVSLQSQHFRRYFCEWCGIHKTGTSRFECLLGARGGMAGVGATIALPFGQAVGQQRGLSSEGRDNTLTAWRRFTRGVARSRNYRCHRVPPHKKQATSARRGDTTRRCRHRRKKEQPSRRATATNPLDLVGRQILRGLVPSVFCCSRGNLQCGL